jgi:osmotically inducible protein OsmC
MAIAERTAETVWEGTLARGGVVRPQSGAFDGLPVTWATRTERPGGKTSPEVLAAAAHSSCFAMASSLRLGERRAEVQRLTISATVTLDEVDGRPTVVSSGLRVRARVPNVGGDALQPAVDEAADLCPIARLYAGAQISVHAELERAEVRRS